MCDWAEVDASGEGVDAGFTRTKVGVIVKLSGNCPRCAHPTATEFTPSALPAAGVRIEPQQVTLYCKCGHAHPNHPDGDNSCGAFWTFAAQL